MRSNHLAPPWSLKQAASILLLYVLTSLPGYAGNNTWHATAFGSYPDVVVTFTNGSGTIYGTEVIGFTSSDCTTGFVTDRTIFGPSSFSYTTGQAYNGNLVLSFSGLFNNAAVSAKVVVYDDVDLTHFTDRCVTVSCTNSTTCTFTNPHAFSLTFS